MAGRFITLEGGEGAGKTTLARGLATVLRARGEAVVVTREPGGTTGADEIRRLLVTGDAGRWSALTETLLMFAARNDHVERIIRPALSRNEIVICDRFIDSTRAYQVAAKGLPADALDALIALTAPPQPDLTLVLDLPAEAGLGRAGSTAAGESRYEALGAAFHASVRRAFLDIAAGAPDRCRVLDATQPAEAVLAAALAEVGAMRDLRP